MLILDQKKFKGFLPDSRASNKVNPVSLWCKLKQKLVLKRLIRRVRNLRKLADQYKAVVEEFEKSRANLLEDTPEGTFQKVGVDK